MTEVNKGWIKYHRGPRMVCLEAVTTSRFTKSMSKSRYCQTSLRFKLKSLFFGVISNNQSPLFSVLLCIKWINSQRFYCCDLCWYSFLAFVKQFDVGKYIELRGNLEVVYFIFLRGPGVVKLCGCAISSLRSFWKKLWQSVYYYAYNHNCASSWQIAMLSFFIWDKYNSLNVFHSFTFLHRPKK